MAGKNQITGGAFQDSKGNVLAYGSLTMQLSHDEQESVDPGQIVGGLPVTIPLDGQGNIAGTVLIWPNDQLVPANSFYTVNAFRRDGEIAWLSPQNFTIPSSPSPYNIGTAIPTLPPVPGVAGGGLSLQTNEVNNGSQTLLDLHAGSNITLTDNALGRVTIAAGGGLTLQTNEVNNGSQTLLDLHAGTNITLTDNGVGRVTVAATPVAQQPSLFPTGVYLPSDNGGAQTSSGFYLTSFSASGLTLAIGTVPTNTVPGFQNAKVSSSVAGSGGNYNTSTAYYASVGMIGRIRTKLRLTQTTNVRVWMALAETSISLITNSPNTNVVGFRYSTAAGDTNWKCVTQTSTIASTIATATGSFLDSSTFHVFETQYDGTTVTFLIDDTVVGTSTTNIPTSGRLMFYIAIDNVGILGQPAFDLAWVVVEARL